MEYRLAWARTYLKKYGLIDNSSRGVWALIDNEIDTSKLDSNKILKTVREAVRKPKTDKKQSKKELDSEIEEEIEDQIDWKEKRLLHNG